MVTLKEVAERAGVSVATASRVLNEPDKVAKKSRTKVLDAIEQLGYSSNLLAKSLRKDGLNAVAVLLPNFYEPLYTQLHQGVADVLESEGYLMISYSTEGLLQNESKMLATARSMGLSGALIYSPHQYGGKGAAELAHPDFPIWFMSDSGVAAKDGLCKTQIDRVAIGAAAAAHLLETHKRNVLCVMDPKASIAEGYYTGVSDCMLKAGGACRLAVAGHTAEDAFRALGTAENTETADAVVTQFVMQGIGAVNYFHSIGRELPANGAVLSLENSSLALLSEPAITCVGIAGYRIGMQSARGLLNRLQNMDTGRTAEILATVDKTPVVRRSTNE